MTSPILLAVPNVSEGRGCHDRAIGARSSTDDGRAGREPLAQRELDRRPPARRPLRRRPPPLGLHARRRRRARSPMRCSRGAPRPSSAIDVVSRCQRRPASAAQHPHVGALDVAPLVYLDRAHARRGLRRGARRRPTASAEELDVPVFLYGELDRRRPARPHARRAASRRGRRALAARLSAQAGGERCAPTSARPGCTRSAGATLVAAARAARRVQPAAGARPPTLARRTPDRRARPRGWRARPARPARDRRRRSSGGVAQVSMNVERPLELPLAEVVAAPSAEHAPLRAPSSSGLAPRARPRGASRAGFVPLASVGAFDRASCAR